MNNTYLEGRPSYCAIRVVVDEDATQEFLQVTQWHPGEDRPCRPDTDGTRPPIDAEHLPPDVANLAPSDCGESRWILAEGDGSTVLLSHTQAMKIEPISTVEGTVSVRLRCMPDEIEDYTAVVLVGDTRLEEGEVKEVKLAAGEYIIVKNGVEPLAIEREAVPQPQEIALTPVIAKQALVNICRSKITGRLGDAQNNAAAWAALREEQLSDEDAKTLAVIRAIAGWVQAVRVKAGELIVNSGDQPEEAVAAAGDEETWPMWHDEWDSTVERFK